MNNNDYINIFNDFKLKTFLKNQNDINMNLNNIYYIIEENNMELIYRFHRKLSNIIKNQNEFNMILINDINKLNTIIKTQETKINDIYDNIYYICIGIFLIIILI
jgi:hypothetical protein